MNVVPLRVRGIGLVGETLLYLQRAFELPQHAKRTRHMPGGITRNCGRRTISLAQR